MLNPFSNSVLIIFKISKNNKGKNIEKIKILILKLNKANMNIIKNKNFDMFIILSFKTILLFFLILISNLFSSK